MLLLFFNSIIYSFQPTARNEKFNKRQTLFKLAIESSFINFSVIVRLKLFVKFWRQLLAQIREVLFLIDFDSTLTRYTSGFFANREKLSPFTKVFRAEEQFEITLFFKPCRIARYPKTRTPIKLTNKRFFDDGKVFNAGS